MATNNGSDGIHPTQQPSSMRALLSDSEDLSSLFNQLLSQSPSGMDPNHHSGSGYTIGNPVASSSSSTFHFSDPYTHAHITNTNTCDFTSPVEVLVQILLCTQQKMLTYTYIYETQIFNLNIKIETW